MSYETDCRTVALPTGLDTVTSFGGGHGLFQTLRADRALHVPFINAIVTVADDGGSSGRLRRELGDLIPPGDLRMALAALARDDQQGALWETVLQHRFGGHGAMAGHSLGNLLIVALNDVLGDYVSALDTVATLVGARGRVLPVANQALDIEAEVSGLDDDPRLMRAVRGQVAVATTPGHVRRVRLLPSEPEACEQALAAIAEADLLTFGPGSWFTSVIPHLLVPQIAAAIAQSSAVKVVVLNLTSEPGETNGFSAERHIHMLVQHCPSLRVDTIIVDPVTVPYPADLKGLQRAADALGATVQVSDVSTADTSGKAAECHDPGKLAGALAQAFSATVQRRAEES